MKPYVIYLRGGIGDQYSFFSMLPAFLKDRNITINNLEIYIDSVYFYAPEQFKQEKQALLSIYKSYGITEFVDIPGNIGSAHDLSFSQEERENGFNLDMHGSEFMYSRTMATHLYFKNIINDRILIDVPFVEHVLEFKNGKYTKLSYPRQLVKLSDLEIKFDLPGKSVIVHTRNKGSQEDDYYYNMILQRIVENGITPIIIGFSSGLSSIGIDARNKFSFEQCMAYIASAKNVLLSGSNFAFHRLASQPKEGISIYNWPMRLGNYYKLNPEEYINNPHNVAFNADENHWKEIANLLIERCI